MITLNDYRQEWLEQIARLDYINHDVGMEEQEIHKHYTGCRVAIDRTPGGKYFGKVVGYYIATSNARVCRIMRLAVEPALKRHYIGTQLFEDLELKYVVGGHQSDTITMPVNEYNLAAQLFLKKMGFRGHYRGKSTIFFQRAYEADGDDAVKVAS